MAMISINLELSGISPYTVFHRRRNLTEAKAKLTGNLQSREKGIRPGAGRNPGAGTEIDGI
jgi:hypothetical protein